MRRFNYWVLLAIFFCLSGCQSKHESQITGEAQGTSYHIKLVLNNSAPSLTDIKQQISATLATIDGQLSSHREDSEISRINRLERTNWLLVSQEIIDLLIKARSVHDRSNGCYDPTIKPLTELWGLSNHQNHFPNQHEIEAMLPHIGMALLEIDAINLRIRKKDPKLKIDISSLAQSYSLGVLAHHLERLGIHNFMIEMGGETMVKGHKANGDNWRIGIEKPTPFNAEVQKIIDLREQQGTALITANTSKLYLENQDEAYTQVFNPLTGHPVTHPPLSVTVSHDDPVWANAWSTALLCLDKEEAEHVVESEHIKAVLIYEKNGQLDEYTSNSFATML